MTKELNVTYEGTLSAKQIEEKFIDFGNKNLSDLFKVISEGGYH